MQSTHSTCLNMIMQPSMIKPAKRSSRDARTVFMLARQRTTGLSPKNCLHLEDSAGSTCSTKCCVLEGMIDLVNSDSWQSCRHLRYTSPTTRKKHLIKRLTGVSRPGVICRNHCAGTASCSGRLAVVDGIERPGSFHGPEEGTSSPTDRHTNGFTLGV
jgi:hypothetical protein